MSISGNRYILLCYTPGDQPLVAALADLLKRALKLSTPQLRCLSLSEWKSGRDGHSMETLRQEILGANVLMGLVTNVSLASACIYFVLGSRWGAHKYVTTIVGAGGAPRLFPGPMSKLDAIACKREDLLQFIDTLSAMLEVRLDAPEEYFAALDEVVATSSRLAAERELAI